ncbi:MAG TPA: phosphate ABC transporter permease PstA [Polyangiaceae bacterium]|jgi:phosphate transport system permease protein|nr:phosphate ABC transporter permease PstA [Polyangiaceae bacterium]
MANAIIGTVSGASSGNSSFHRSLGNRRTLGNIVLTGLAVLLSVLAMLPLFSVLYMLLVKGAALLSPSLFTELTPGAGMDGGGIANAIVGTLVVVVVATCLALPLGFMGAVYLAEYGGESRLATLVRFAAKVLTGLPSILAGVFAYATVVVATGSFSALAGGAAMAILMVPTVMLTSESALRAVPAKMKMAAFGMGATHAQTVLRIVIPTAIPGILTGVMLSLARAMGETAPLLFTALFSDYMFEGKLAQPIASLSVLIYNFAGSPFEHQVALAWAASLVLVSIVLVLNVVAQIATRRPEEHG